MPNLWHVVLNSLVLDIGHAPLDDDQPTLTNSYPIVPVS